MSWSKRKRREPIAAGRDATQPLSARATAIESNPHGQSPTRNLKPAAFIRACGRSYRCANTLTMLYGRWRQIVCEHRHELALCDLASGQSWTFGQLDAAVEGTAATSDAILFPRGISAEFVFTVLRAWRAGKLTCPLEAGQPVPDFSRLPSGSVHLKTTSATTDVPRLIALRLNNWRPMREIL